MDEEKILIMANGKDKTKQVESFSENQYGKIEIKYYKNEKIYSYYKNNVTIIEEPEEIDINGRDVYYKNQVLLIFEK